MLFQIAADAVFAAHLTLLLFIGVGAAAAMRAALLRHILWGRLYWTSLALTGLSQFLPGCPLTQLELWVRRLDDPASDRTHSILNTTQHFITRMWLPEWVFTALLVAVLVISIYAWFRYRAWGQWLTLFRGASPRVS